MNIDDVLEWMEIADNDFDSAILLDGAVRKHCEIICYHCAQAVEKYLKAYLVFKGIVPKKTHDLLFLVNVCNELNDEFESIVTECSFLNKFTNDIRYPHKYQINENDVVYSIKAVYKIKDFSFISGLREIKNETVEKPNCT
ncbi:MAG: HEPN domain-containing protein [Treponema sp.]|nr:HEPN domain-containing protein [Treponema sp.]